MDTSIFLFLLAVQVFYPSIEADPVCHPKCGSLQLQYPFGAGYGCGSPRFYPYVTCVSDHLILTTHTGSYLITSISYDTTTLTISPPYMSTCNTMQRSPNLGLDWASPFQLGPSTIILLSCTPPTSSPICDLSSSHLCDAIYTCPSVIGLGLPLFPPSNTCCVYSPANFNTAGELNLHDLKCAGYAAVASFQDSPTDPTKWEYGVVLEYKNGAFDDYEMNNKCHTCEGSGGVCGYATNGGGNSFLCVCNGGFNTTSDCYNNHNQIINQDEDDDPVGIISGLTSSRTWSIWLELLAVLFFYLSQNLI